ncbi:MAG TPA: sigma-70 family RNA polymerase sigma factor [Candidatus Angelobacter sp.]|nr:sigma-70 family RNA polymerase sigma factor [Candidatus Angelobacter sp.]
MASTTGDRIGQFPASLHHSAVTHQSAPPGDAQDDSRLVEAAREGDRMAFGQLYDRYSRMVHGILLARVPLSEVNDLVQDVFLRALPRLHALRDVNRFGAWLAAITRNRANDYHRHAVEEVELPEDLPGDGIESQAAGSSVDAEAWLLLSAIRGLPETYREILLLRLVEGMTGPEIAARTGLKHGSVRVNLHRGMQKLREKLASIPRAAREQGI